MRKSVIAMGCCVLLGVSLLTGCGSKEEDTQEYQAESAQVDKAPQGNESSKMVKVTSVDGNTITAELGENAGGAPQGSMEPPSQDGAGKGEAPQGSMEPPSKDGAGQDKDGKGGEPPQGSMSPDGKMPEGSMEPPSQDGDGKGEKQQGQPGDMGDMEFTSSGESITFQVTDDTVISKGGGEDSDTASLDDISEDTILMVELDDDNNATKIMIRQ
jgi:hypothetical protein